MVADYELFSKAKQMSKEDVNMEGTPNGDEPKAPRITIYHIEGRRSIRVVWLCEELGLPYELVFRQGDIAGSMATIREVHPEMPLAPVVSIDGDFIVESGAILDVLSARYGNGKLIPPVESRDYLFHAQWMHFAEGTALARMSIDFFSAASKGVPTDDNPAGYRRGETQANLMVGSLGSFDFAERHLSHHRYFGGSQFSAADIMMQFMFPVAWLMSAIDVSSYKNISRWRSEVEGRAAFKRAVRKCLPSGTNEYGLPADQPLLAEPVARDRLRRAL